MGGSAILLGQLGDQEELSIRIETFKPTDSICSASPLTRVLYV
jgi:hypothetical protein